MPRARVPKPPSFDFAIRPKSNVPAAASAAASDTKVMGALHVVGRHTAPQAAEGFLEQLQKRLKSSGVGKDRMHAVRINISGSVSGSH